MIEDKVMDPQDHDDEDAEPVMSMKLKEVKSNDNMPKIKLAYESADKSRYSEHRT